jgi:threonylcarbamoyladenosine tRNA methylthiotransferase MtaB
MRIFLDQIGCRLNYSEMDTLAGRLQAAGHLLVADAAQAQVIVFNSCAVTAEAGRKSRQRVRSLHRRNAQARIAVTGCWATLRPEAAADLPGVALVADNGRKDILHALLEPWSAELDDPDDVARIEPNGTPFSTLDDLVISDGLRPARTRAFVKVQDGCNNKCTFCIVTVARGAGRSRPVSDVVAEVRRLTEAGVREVVLTGVHLGSYGRDFGRDLTHDRATDLKELAAAILRETDILRLRLSSLEPWELAEGFFELWQEWPERLCPHLHVPLQAGTDKQLRHMARRCTTESFRRLVEDARAAIPDVVLTTDLIVGFPGETEDDFGESLRFVEEMRFAHAHIFPFSAREGTAAARFGNRVPKAVKQERSRRMHGVVERTGREERGRFAGQVRPVLWEGQGMPLTDEPGLLWTGLTDNYLRVTTTAPEGVDLHNALTPVHLYELQGETLFGRIVEPQRMGRD